MMSAMNFDGHVKVNDVLGKYIAQLEQENAMLKQMLEQAADKQNAGPPVEGLPDGAPSASADPAGMRDRLAKMVPPAAPGPDKKGA